MKPTLPLLLLPFAVLASARSIWGGNTGVSTLADAFPVAGDNPLLYCQDPKDYILDIEKVDLSPNPPVPGKPLNITAKGTLSKDVEEGAHVHIEVKWGLVRLINENVLLCDEVDKVDLKCPLKKGTMELTKSVDIPTQVPPGKYTVLAVVTTKDNKLITCLTSVVFMKRPSFSAEVEAEVQIAPEVEISREAEEENKVAVLVAEAVEYVDDEEEFEMDL